MNPHSMDEPIGTRLRPSAHAPDLGMEYAPWSKAALRLEFPAEMFDSDQQGASAHEAKRVCRRCPVIEPCLEEALRIERGQAYSHGVRGGMSAQQRRQLIIAERREQPPELRPCGTPAARQRHRRRNETCEACGVGTAA